ncbi:MAG: alpha-L-fucosidase [Armatimonadota bacterium]
MTSPKEWLADGMMNMLVDYYPEIQFNPYGAGATRENVLPVLRDLELGYLCIYAKGHSGYTTWPSSLRTQHNMLAQDMPRFFREVTRETGTRLVLYYSGMLDGIAGLRNPDWRMRNIDGNEIRMFDDFKVFMSYSNCPHSGYFDEWVAVQLRELIEGYDPDGIWVDGDWGGPCYCPRCQAKFREETGWSESWSDIKQRPDFNAAYLKFWNGVTHQWRTRFNDCVKSLKPDCAYSAGNVCARREFLAPFDWRSGDFFSPGYYNLHHLTQMMRWYTTLGVPYDAYVCDTSFTHVRKNVRSRSKSLDRMLQESAAIAATGASVGYWTYPLGNGALVPSRMEKAKAVRQFLREREDVFLHSESAQWTAILASDPSLPATCHEALTGANKAMSGLHRSADVMDETGVREDMPYDLVVLPDQERLDEETAKKLLAWIERGGKLLSCGASINLPMLRQALGITGVKRAAIFDGHVILKTHGEPTGVDAAWDRLEGGEELYPLYLTWDQFNPENRDMPNNWPMYGQVDEEEPEPAGFPAAVTKAVGKGRVVHVCTDIFTRYLYLGDPQMLRWLREIVDEMQPEALFTTDAPSWMDVSLRKKGDALLVHFVNYNPGRDVARLHTDDLWVDEIPAVGPITSQISLAARPAAVTLEPGSKAIDWTWQDGMLEVVVPKVRIHGCIKIVTG